jgi:hypothetical protein
MGVLELTGSPRRIITIFGSSRVRENDPDYRLANDLGVQIARAGFAVCNGGYGGIMEASARGARSAGGHTIGVTTNFYAGAKANSWIDEVVRVPTPYDRLLKLLTLGDGYVVLKGGTGTLLELAASWEFINKGVFAEKPIVVVGSFWDGVVRTLKEELAWEGLENCTRFVSVVNSPGECVLALKKWFAKQ